MDGGRSHCGGQAAASASRRVHVLESHLGRIGVDAQVRQFCENKVGPGGCDRTPRVVVFSGGSGMQNFIDDISRCTNNICVIVPITDDGGSTSEIIRVLGGPAIGDVRNVLMRCARRKKAIVQANKVLALRLHPTDAKAAAAEFWSIVEGTHRLWVHVPHSTRDIIRPFLAYFHSEVLFRSRVTEPFNFCNGCIGNFYLTGARLFFHSLTAAIYLYARTAVLHHETRVTPVLEDRHNTTYQLRLRCRGGVVIRGQTAIGYGEESAIHATASRHGYSREGSRPPQYLPAKPSRLETVSSSALWPTPPIHKELFEELAGASLVVYGRGSYLTSLLASLSAPSIGEAISRNKDARKALLVNGGHDRETRYLSAADDGVVGLNIGDLIELLVETVNGAADNSGATDDGSQCVLRYPVESLLTDVIIVDGSDFELSDDVRRDYPTVQFTTVPRDVNKPQLVYDDEVLVRHLLGMSTGR